MINPYPISDAHKMEDRYRKGEIVLNHIVDALKPKLICKSCYDSGYAWLLIEEGETKHSVWVYCNCKCGADKESIKTVKIPRLDSSLLSLYKVKEFPLKAFVPSNFTLNYEKALWNKVASFSNDLKNSEEFWSQRN